MYIYTHPWPSALCQKEGIRIFCGSKNSSEIMLLHVDFRVKWCYDKPTIFFFQAHLPGITLVNTLKNIPGFKVMNNPLAINEVWQISRLVGTRHVWLLTYFEHTEHRLGHIEGMSPVMVSHISVILLHTQNPTTKCLKQKKNLFLISEEICYIQIVHEISFLKIPKD